jgi:uncharacterized membrane protein
MAGWSRTGRLSRSAKAMVAVMLLALVLVAAVPVAFLVGIFLMIFGHVVAGLALFGASILLAGAGVTFAILSGIRQVRHLRDMVTNVANGDFRVLRLNDDDYSYTSADSPQRDLRARLP